MNDPTPPPDDLDPALWQQPSFGRLLWEQLDGEWFIYNIANGSTHYVNDATARILKKLAEEPATAEELCRMLGHEDDRGYLSKLGSHLQLLSEIGLVERSE